ncbi:MAG: extracellular solute-binding protein, partial [Candidatus Nealsonbacteria bacterium]|nr:extracellular solute-binding protein [Candidatus Nealsonbacteria bacterium]
MALSVTAHRWACRPHRTQSVGVGKLTAPHRLPLLCLLTLLAGCPGPEPVAPPSDAVSLDGVELRLVVVDDPSLVAAAERLQGQWKTLTGSEFRVVSIGEAELAEADVLPGDAAICPSYLLGPLAQRKLIAALPEELPAKIGVRGKGNRFSDVFELVKLREAVWNAKVMAVPFGSPVLTCYYRADLLEQLGRRPPQTWTEYQELARLLAERSEFGVAASPWCGTIEPLAPGWAGLVLLARAAPYAKHDNNYSTLFDIETMEPLVSGPPLVRALEELVAAAEAGPQQPLDYDPAGVRTAFWQGRCGMALSWPTAAKGAVAAEVESAELPVGFAELPGSIEVYDVGRQTWDIRSQDDDPMGQDDDDPMGRSAAGHVPLLAVAGRLGVVARESKNGRAAFELLFWLSGDHSAGQVCSASPATTL